jgi:hypothetical protein
MMRYLTATVLAIGLAAPLPAVADKDEGRGGADIRQLVAGAALIGLLGLALSNRDRDRNDTPAPQPQEPHDPWRLLPGSCLDVFDTARGRLDIFNADCLDARYGWARQLPLTCAVATRVQGRFVSGYDAACLEQRGYEVSNRF